MIFNFFKKLNRNFTSSSVQKEYEAFYQTQFIKFLRIFFLLMAVYGIYSSVSFHLSGRHLGGYILLGWTLLLLIMWKVCTRLQKFMGLVVILVFVPIFIPGFIHLNSLLKHTPKLFYPFFSGYFLGFFERIVAQRLPGMLYKTGYACSGFLVRILVFGRMMFPFLITHIFVISIGLIFDFFKICEYKRLFQTFYDYREELIKFRTLMVSGIPSKILILSKDLKQKLFLNEQFQLLIGQQIESQSQIQDFLSKVHIEKNTLDQPAKLLVDSHCQPDQAISTLQFLQILTDQSLVLNQSQKITFDASFSKESPSDHRVFEVTVFSLLWDSQDAVAIILNDVTVQHQNLALKIADANKDKMLALISHELRTPLNGILGVVQLLEKDANDPLTLQHLKICKASGHLLLNLVNSILDLQQIRDHKFSLKVTQVNIQELVHEVYDLFKFQFEQKGLKLALDVDLDLPKSFSTDQNRLKQILINLIGNALKFTFEGGVEISAHRIESSIKTYLEFTVSDTGTGIKEEDQSKLFKMYGRLDQENPQTNTQGVGFGLEISNQLAKLLCEGDDGGIKFNSQLGKGTTFRFFIKDIPREDTSELLIKTKARIQKKASRSEIEDLDIDELEILKEQPDNLSRKMSLYSTQTLSKVQVESMTHLPQNQRAHRSKTQTSRPFLASTNFETRETEGLEIHTESSEAVGLCKESERFSSRHTVQKNLKILIVDDNPFNLLIAKHLAENLGYTTNSALNGRIAVDMIRKSEGAYCAVLMDLQMPVMDGYEATKILKKMMENGEILEIPIIALSANDSSEDKKRCKEIGMKDHISKPLDEKRLKRVLEEITEESDSSSSSAIQFTDPK